MAKWVNSDVLDGGLNAIKNAATVMLLIKAYSAGDSYATVTGNAVASVAVAPGDFTLSSSGSNRVCTGPAGKTSNASAAAASPNNLHIAFTDGAAKVLWVTDETTDQAITAGNPVAFPQLAYTSNQPT